MNNWFRNDSTVINSEVIENQPGQKWLKLNDSEEIQN